MISQSTVTRLRELRRAKGITVKRIADQLGVHEMTVYAWQGGRRRPSLAMAQALAELLDCSIDELFPREAA
jgi:transcriptional regulator with XRE-family HTH domain